MRPGYKQTEVGVIPEDWDLQPLGSFAKVTSGKRLPAGYFVGDAVTPYPYIRVTDMRPGWVDASEVKFVPVAAFPPIKNYRIYKDDLFISVAGTLGIVGKVPDDLDGANLTENANRISAIECDRDYLLHVMLSPVVQGVIESEQTIGAQPKLALARIRKFSIPLPPSEVEQSAIATALGDVDALLAAQDALIAKKRAIKQGAMQELLTGKRRLPGFSGEWEVKPSAQIGYFRGGTGFPLSSQGGQGGEYPFFKVSDMNNDGNKIFMENANNWISDPTRKQLGATAFPAGSIVFAKVGAAIFLERKKILSRPSCIDNNMAAFVIDENQADISFIHLQLLNVKFGALVATTALPALNGKVLSEMLLTLPPTKEEQTAIAEVLTDIDTQLTALETQRTKTAQLKQGMMQALLTGRIRLI